MVRQFVASAGLEAEPLPLRCVACNSRNPLDTHICIECEAILETPLWAEGETAPHDS
jgi:hypothetical protein